MCVRRPRGRLRQQGARSSRTSTQSDAPPAAAPADASQAPDQPPAPLQATSVTWAPEALEELLAPVALYPDPVLVQVLTAATNPQEVLDAGNWLGEP